jgi:hypothetical protein
VVVQESFATFMSPKGGLPTLFKGKSGERKGKSGERNGGIATTCKPAPTKAPATTCKPNGSKPKSKPRFDAIKKSCEKTKSGNRKDPKGSKNGSCARTEAPKTTCKPVTTTLCPAPSVIPAYQVRTLTLQETKN